MSFDKYFKPAPAIRPRLNLGCLLDIPTGKYHTGKDGESILNGGLAYFTGIGGRGNMFKSTVMHMMFLRIMDRYGAPGLSYDTETSLTLARLYALAAKMPNIGGVDLEEEGLLRLTDSTEHLGNDWFELLKQAARERAKEKSNWATTPFVDKKGEPVRMPRPMVAECDSLSMMPIESIETIYNKNEIGESGMNVEAMRASAAKSQMLMQVPNLTASTGCFLMVSAHVGDSIQMDPYAPNQKKLSFMKNSIKFKQVPEKFTFLTNNLWLCVNAEVFQNRNTKGPEFPAHPDDNNPGDTDLQLVTLLNLRAKDGPTGMPLQLVVSQREGVLIGLSELHHLRSHGKFGMGGHDRAYYLELYPEVSMQRTTARSTIEGDVKLQRALEITSELCQIHNLWADLEPGLFCEPKDLYEGLKSKGYDWDILLDTRGYWVFDPKKEEKPYLSTMDLLKMNLGTYTPKWYEGVVKAKAKADSQGKEKADKTK